jgi:hypothetical protein
MSAPTGRPGEGATTNTQLDSTRFRCGCPICRPALPLGRLRDDPELAAATVRAAWAAKLALTRWRATRGGRP